MKNEDLYYILDENNKPVPEPDLVKWSDYVLSGRNILKRTLFKREIDDQEVLVVTSFTGLTNIPGECYQCFESVLECDRGNGGRSLCNTYEDAIKSHDLFVESAKNPKYFNDAATKSNLEYMLKEREEIREARNYRERRDEEVF